MDAEAKPVREFLCRAMKGSVYAPGLLAGVGEVVLLRVESQPVMLVRDTGRHHADR